MNPLNQRLDVSNTEVRNWKHECLMYYCKLDDGGAHVAGNGLHLTASKEAGTSVLQPQGSELCQQPE